MTAPEAVERHAGRISGGLLFTLAAYVLASAGYGLWRQEGQDFSTAGFILAALAIPIMYVLTKVKIRLATQLGSRSLRADAVESIACGYLSGTVLVGLLAQLVIGAWWVDSVTALAIVWILVKEGHEAWSGEDEPPA